MCYRRRDLLMDQPTARHFCLARVASLLEAFGVFLSRLPRDNTTTHRVHSLHNPQP